MIKIALCDDNEVERRLLRKIVTVISMRERTQKNIPHWTEGQKPSITKDTIIIASW